MLLLKDLGLVECLVKHQLVGKFPGKLMERDWGSLYNTVGVLNESCCARAICAL